MKKTYDCAIVCGYPTLEDGSISPILQSRIDKAIALYYNQSIRYIIVSGAAVHNAYSEALCMKNYALAHHVPEDHIIVEDQALSTYHNMMYAKALMERYHFQDCLVITNSWHMIKARYYARKFALNFAEAKAARPPQMSWFKVALYTLYMPINMLINRCKGYK